MLRYPLEVIEHLGGLPGKPGSAGDEPTASQCVPVTREEAEGLCRVRSGPLKANTDVRLAEYPKLTAMRLFREAAFRYFRGRAVGTAVRPDEGGDRQGRPRRGGRLV